MRRITSAMGFTMNPEKLAMLTAKGLNPEHVAGSLPEITQMDVAGAMAGLDLLEHELMRVKYCGDEPFRLFSLWWAWLDQNADWADDVTGYVARFTVAEAVSANRCHDCKGVGEMMANDKVIVCPTCVGTGMRYERPESSDTEIEWARRELHRVEYAAIQKLASE